MVNKGRQISGGKYAKDRKKKKFEIQGQKRIIKLGEDKRKTQRTLGGNSKTVMLKAQTINVTDSKNKTQKTTIKNVLETPSNKFLARQNVITKGTIVETDLGKARVTNRPTQQGVLNGILIE